MRTKQTVSEMATEVLARGSRLGVTGSLSVVLLSDVAFGLLPSAFGGISSILVTLFLPNTRRAGNARQALLRR